MSAEVHPRQDWAAVESALQALVAALTARGVYDAERGWRAVDLAWRVVERLGLDAELAANAAATTMLADVGKLSLPDALLRKHGELTAEERAALTEQPELGAHIVASIPALASLAPAVRACRERWDGSGYPDGLAGGSIPIEAQIASACTALDAMLADTPYRARLDPRTACAVLERNAGTQFAPDVARALREEVEQEREEAAPEGAAPTPAAPVREERPAEPPRERSPGAEAVIAAFEQQQAPEAAPTAPSPALRALAADAAAIERREVTPERPTRQGGLSRAQLLLSAIIGLAVGLVISLPFRSVAGRCPASGDTGYNSCYLQKAILPTVMESVGIAALVVLIAYLALVAIPRRVREGPKPREPKRVLPSDSDDPLLVAATRGLTRDDARQDA